MQAPPVTEKRSKKGFFPEKLIAIINIINQSADMLDVKGIACVILCLLGSCANYPRTKVVDKSMEASCAHYELLPGRIRGSTWLNHRAPVHARKENALAEFTRAVDEGVYKKSFIMRYWGVPDSRFVENGVEYFVYTGLDPGTGGGISENLSPTRPIKCGYRRGSLCYAEAYFRRARGAVPDVAEWVVP